MHPARLFVICHGIVAYVLGCSRDHGFGFCFETPNFKWLVKPITSNPSEMVNLSYTASTGTHLHSLTPITEVIIRKSRTFLDCVRKEGDYPTKCKDTAVAADFEGQFIKKGIQFDPAGVFETIDVSVIMEAATGPATDIVLRLSDESTNLVCFRLGVPDLSGDSKALACNLLYFVRESYNTYKLTTSASIFIQTIQPFHSKMKYPTFSAITVNQVKEVGEYQPISDAFMWPFIYTMVNIGIGSDSKRKKYVRNLNIFEPTADRMKLTKFIAICIQEEPIVQAPSPIFNRKVSGNAGIDIVWYMTCKKGARLSDSGIAVVKIGISSDSTEPNPDSMIKFNFISNSDLSLPPGNTTLMQEASNDRVMIHYGENEKFAGFNMYDTASFDADKSAKELFQDKDKEFIKVFKKPTEDALKDKLAVNFISGRKKRSVIPPILSFNVPGISYQPPVFYFDKLGFKIVIVHDNSLFHQFVANPTASPPVEWFHVSAFKEKPQPASLISLQPLDYDKPVEYMDAAGKRHSLNQSNCDNNCTSCVQPCKGTNGQGCPHHIMFRSILKPFEVKDNDKFLKKPNECKSPWFNPTTDKATRNAEKSTTHSGSTSTNRPPKTTSPKTRTTKYAGLTAEQIKQYKADTRMNIILSITLPLLWGIFQAVFMGTLCYRQRKIKQQSAEHSDTKSKTNSNQNEIDKEKGSKKSEKDKEKKKGKSEHRDKKKKKRKGEKKNKKKSPESPKKKPKKSKEKESKEKDRKKDKSAKKSDDRAKDKKTSKKSKE